jgi:hypothetical protein
MSSFPRHVNGLGSNGASRAASARGCVSHHRTVSNRHLTVVLTVFVVCPLVHGLSFWLRRRR